MTIDLQTARTILQDAAAVLDQLDGVDLDDASVTSKTVAARTNRQLLNLADQLLTASCLVRNEYWGGRDMLSYDL